MPSITALDQGGWASSDGRIGPIELPDSFFEHPSEPIRSPAPPLSRP